MKVFQWIGIAVTVLAVLGALGIGNFRLYYGKEVICTPVKGAKP